MPKADSLLDSTNKFNVFSINTNALKTKVLRLLLLFVLVRRSVDMLHCRCALGIGQVHPISAFLLWSFPYYVLGMCVRLAGPQNSFPQWASWSLKSEFERAHAAIQTRPPFNVPYERRGITFQPQWQTRSTTALAEMPKSLRCPRRGVRTTDLWYARRAHRLPLRHGRL